MKTIPIILFFFFYLLGCGDSNQQPLEKADRLMQQAVSETNNQNYEEAERLLAECTDLYSGDADEAKLSEIYSTLSSVQLLTGKLSPGLETLTALRGIYQRSGDRSAELQTMIQIGKIYFQLGRTESAFAILTEAYNNSTLFRLDAIALASAQNVSQMYFKSQKFENALQYAALALQTSKEQRNPSAQVEAQNIRIASLAAMGNISKAFEAFREAEPIARNEKTITAAQFYLRCGTAFVQAEEWQFAKRNFERVLLLAQQLRDNEQAQLIVDANIAIAELYAGHFAFADAQACFIRAYQLAKDRSDNMVTAYLLVRIADCIAEQSSQKQSQENTIRATQLYEQAQTLFSRSGFIFGEAITMHRLGMIKEQSGDDNAAVTFYKRAYDRFAEQMIDPNNYSFPFPIERLYRSRTTAYSPVEWFSQNLLSLLLKYKKTNEAYSYLQHVRSVLLQAELFRLPLHFRDQSKENKYSALSTTMAMYRQNLLELHHINATQQQMKRRNYANTLQQQIAYHKSKMLSDAVTLSQEFPVFSFFTKSQRSTSANILNVIPPAHMLLDYVVANNEAWVFTARAGEEITAVKLSSYGYALERKMRNYCELLSSSSIPSDNVRKLSNELFEFLVKPIDRNGIQRIVIIPPLRWDRFPFHSLTADGIPLLEKTGVSYLHHSGLLTSIAPIPKFINSIAAFGFTSNSRWGLEFELRDIRSFFRTTQVHINQSATKQKLEAAVGEMVQISSLYTVDGNNDSWFTLSDGSTSKAGVNVPVSEYPGLHPFQIVYLSDVQSTANSMLPIHSLLWLLNGSTSVITTQFPITSNVSKTFGENLYSSLSSEVNPFLAYRRAAVYLGKKKDLNNGYGGSSYFYYGVK